MISTVTTSTVTTITSTITAVTGFTEVFSVAAVLALLVLLVSREVIGGASGRIPALFMRGLAIGIVPLALAFALIAGTSLVRLMRA